MNIPVDRFPVKPTDYQDIVPVRAGYQHCAPGYHFGPQLRDSWTIQYIVSGTGTIIKDGRKFRAAAGECFILKPGEEISLTADNATPWYYIWVGFRARIPMPEILIREDIIPGKKLESIFFEIASCNRHTNRPLEPFLLSYIWKLLAQLYLMTPSSPGAIKTKAEIYAEEARNLIHQSNACTNVHALAQQLHLNRSYLSRIFREFTGMSIQNYIHNVRFQLAGTLLQTHTISQTASILGYSDTASFSRAFKSYYKLSPCQYMAQHKVQNTSQPHSKSSEK